MLGDFRISLEIHFRWWGTAMIHSIDRLNREMANEINRLPEGEMGEVILDDELFAGIPELDKFLDPPDDVMQNAPESPDEDWTNDILTTRLFLLGMYIPMRSPGQVTLFGRNLRWFYWALVRVIRHQVPYMTKLDLQAAWSLVLMKTHEHEKLFGGSHTPIIEKALAVVWSRMKIQEKRGVWQRSIRWMNELFCSQLMQRAFNYDLIIIDLRKGIL